MPIGQFLFNLVTDPHFKRQYTFFTRQTIENKMEKDAYIPIPKQKLGKNPSLRRKSSADDSVKTKGSEAVEESEKKELTEVQVDVPQQEEYPSMNEPEGSTKTLAEEKPDEVSARAKAVEAFVQDIPFAIALT